MSERWRLSPARQAVGLAIGAVALATLPGWLVGALAVQMQESLDFNESQLGVAVGLFMLVSAALSMPAGRVAERIGPANAIVLVAAGGVLASAGIAAAARQWWHLVVLLVVAAMANTLAGPSANLGLVERVPVRVHGMAFAIKQAAIPLATLLAGVAVPLVALTVGWRWAFAGVSAGCVALCCLALTARRVPRPRAAGAAPGVRRGNGVPPTTRPALILLGLGAGLAGAVSGCLGAFLVVYAVSIGVDTSTAGLLLGLGSAVSIGVRLSLGWHADRRGSRPLLVVVAMLVAGSLGIVLIALGHSLWLLALGTVLAFGAGWGWNGLFHMSLMKHYREQAAAATGLAQTLMFLGTGIGPVAFGFTAQHLGFDVAWWSAVGTTLAAAGLVAWGRNRLARSR